ncbi:MAG: hypothetical protein V4692_11910, partial [Bdellovibrionota bacterium]
RSGNRWDFTTIVRLMRVAVANGQLVKKSETEWRVSRNEEPEPVGFMIERGATASIVSGLVQLPNGDVFAQADSAVYRIDLASDSLSAQPLTLENCPTGARELGIRGLNGKTFLTSSALVPSENFPGNDFERRFISELALEGATGRCGVSVNVPGFPMVVADTGYIMSDDTWANNLRWEEYGGHPQEEGDASLDEEPSRYRYLRMDTHGAFTSVKFETDTATLTDTFDRKEQYGSAFHKISDSRIIRMESAGKKLKFESVDLTAQGKLLRIDFDTETDLTADYGSGIVKVARGSRGLYAAVRSGGKFEVFKILEDGRPLRLPLVTYNQLGEPNRSVMTANLASSWGWSNHYHFDFETNSFITSEGMFGVTRIKILD